LSERVPFRHGRALCVVQQRLSQIVFIAVVGIIKQTILKSPAFSLRGSDHGGGGVRAVPPPRLR